MNSKEYQMMRNKEALRLERTNLMEAIRGLEYCMINESYQNAFSTSWINGNPSIAMTRIAGLLAQQNLLQDQIQEEDK